ncbi:MAG: DUF456 family protein [Kiritimatiellae bacterium]|nr:DUF456 family protein [Kiritimatiellia bacterium]
MDYVWFSLGALALLIGIIGCFIPVLPGPVFAYLALWCRFLMERSLSTRALIGATVALGVVLLLDFYASSFGTKKFGGSRWGIAGCLTGTIAGVFFAPWGLILGPLLGAFIGELVGGKTRSQATKAAIGAFIGFVFGTLVKFVLCLVYVWMFLLFE